MPLCPDKNKKTRVSLCYRRWLSVEVIHSLLEMPAKAFHSKWLMELSPWYVVIPAREIIFS